MKRSALALLSLVGTLSFASYAVDPPEPDFNLLLDFGADHVLVRQGIIGPEAPGGVSRVLTTASITRAGKTSELSFFGTAQGDTTLNAAAGMALAAVLGFAQGLTAAEIHRTFGPGVALTVKLNHLDKAFTTTDVAETADLLAAVVQTGSTSDPRFVGFCKAATHFYPPGPCKSAGLK